MLHTTSYDSPLSRAINPKEWWWNHPVNDVIVGVFDSLQFIGAIVSRRPKIKKTDLPKRTLRPWDKTKETEVLKVKASPIGKLRKLLGWD